MSQIIGYILVAGWAVFAVAVLKTLRRIRMNLNDLLGQVQAQKTVADSVVTLLTNLSGQLQTAINNLTQAGADTAEIQQISDALTANTQELVAAVSANTPPQALTTEPAPAPAPAASTPATAAPAAADPAPSA